jgi:S-adenosylmethionine hydrolase
MTPGLVSLPNDEDGAIVGEVWWVDRFGNCQLNIDPAELQSHGVDVDGRLELRFGDQARMARWVRTYADAKPSELVMLVDSYGLMSVALDRRSAAQELGLAAGSGITVVPPPGGAQ